MRRFTRWVCVLAGLLLLVWLSGRLVRAQAGAGRAAAPAAPAAQPEPARDALGRETPRKTVIGFISAARKGNNEILPAYLDTNLQGQAAVDLARKLFVVLDSRLPARLNELSDRPEGSSENPLKPDENIVGTINMSGSSFDVVVERITRGTSAPIWLFSRKTLSSIPAAYAEIDLVVVDRYVPDILSKPRIGGVRLFEWLVLLLVLPAGYRLLGSLDWVFRPLMRVWRRRTGFSNRHPDGHVPGLVRLVILAVAIRWILGSLDLPLVERQFWSAVATLVLIAAFGWGLLLLNGYGESYLKRFFGGGGETASLVRLVRRAADVLVIAACVLATLRYFGFDPTAALAGLGIGGIAVALAAQKTLENVIAGLSLIFDKAIQIGDVLKFGETVGTVDFIGLRSTRIRTLDRTILTVPNGQIASVGIEILSVRDKFWFHHFLGLQYGTTADQMRSVIDGVQRLLASHSKVDRDSVRVRFFRLGTSSLDIEITAYIFTADFGSFLDVQQELLLRIMEAVDASGTSIAFPSQTLHIAEGRLPDPQAEGISPGTAPSGAPGGIRKPV
jgi:MscS family membrane protein